MLVLSAACLPPPPATAQTRVRTARIPPPPPETDTGNKRPATVLRLPPQAGKVSKIMPTKLVPNGPSWIAKGDRYYSLCVPNRRMVACSPIVATSVMQDIDVGAGAGAKGEPKLTFKVSPRTKLSPKRLQSAISYFIARTNKSAKHFRQMSVSYAPRPAETYLLAGGGGGFDNSVDAGNGTSGCSYDDEGSYDCTGGSYEGGSGGADPFTDPESIPVVPGDDCLSNCSYPSGNENGETDPCANASCPVVLIPGTRPGNEEPVSLPSCRAAGPFVIECTTLPPLSEPQELPRGPTPWFPQGMCNLATIFCSAGQVPDNDRGTNSELSGKTMDELYEICYRTWEAEMDVCSANRAAGADYRTVEACKSKATSRLAACQTTAREVTDNGAHTAP